MMQRWRERCRSRNEITGDQLKIKAVIAGGKKKKRIRRNEVQRESVQSGQKNG